MAGPTSALLRVVQERVRRVPGSFVAPWIEAVALPGMGVGVVAKERVPKDALVFQASRDAWYPISAEYALHEAQQKAPGFMRQLDALFSTPSFRSSGSSFVPNALMLGTHLAMSAGGALAGPSSDRSATLSDAYLQSLPEFVDLPFYWDEQQFEALDACHEVRQSIQQSARFYFQLYQHLFGDENQIVPAEKFFWSISVLMSRATSGKQQPFTLIPFFDWFNHANHGDECVQEYDAENGFTIHTTREYAPGEQLFINYGAHGNTRLLRNYGFTMPNNPFDTAVLSLPAELQQLDPADKTSQDKATLLSALGIGAKPKTVTLLSTGALTSHSHQWLQFRLADADEMATMIQQVSQSVGGGKTDGKVPTFKTPDSLDQKIQSQIRQLCSTRLRQHKNSIQHDEKFLETHHQQMAPWLRSAVHVRLSEKRVLSMAAASERR